MLRSFIGTVLVLSLLGVTAAPRPVSVLYAGSLVTQMEGPIRAAMRLQGIDVQGEPGGSKALANLIASGLRTPDVFISVDPSLVAGLGDRVVFATTFASTQLGIGWTDHSRDAALFARVAAGKSSLLAALAIPGLRIGRTDPRIDPKGSYTIEGTRLLAGATGERELLGTDENPAQTFPEETLLARLETGEIDVGFFYRTEAVAKGLHFLPLPGKADLADKITYTLAILRNAPHPHAAQAFATFLIHGQGRAILKRAGLVYR
ncbi:MAG: extracellular solute-binding protein [Vulcanimicrobiaceae bacterium]